MQKKIIMKNSSFLTLIVLILGLSVLGTTCGPKPPPNPPPIPNPVPTSVTDIDKNTYRVKRFGNTMWMTENLRVTRYDTKSPVSEDTIAVATYDHAVSINKPYYINAQDFEEPPYTDNLTETIRKSLGFLYNWSAAVGTKDNNMTVEGTVQGICPDGWRLPNNTDWENLFNHLEGKETAGNKLKSVYGWFTLAGSGTNESGLSCYPAGLAAGNFVSFVGMQSMFWSTKSQSGNITRAEVLKLFFDKDEAEISNINKFQANSVRCVMDYKEYDD